MQRLIRITLAALVLLCATSAQARTADEVLELIGSLEAPEGFNQYYGGIKEHPPKPLTFMTVGEVLDWQRRAARTSVSTAAGRFQIIRPTLQGLVNQGVVSESERFSPETQTKLGRHLLAQTGFRDGDTSTRTANKIARVWAALPLVDGAGAGQSAYVGVAGNRALITAEDYMAFLGGELDASDIAKRVAVYKDAISFASVVETVFTKIKENAYAISGRIQSVSLTLLWALFTIQIIFHGSKMVMNGHLGTALIELAFRLFFVGLLSFFILYIDDIMQLMELWADRLATSITEQDDIDLANYLFQRSFINIQLLEASIPLGWPMQVSVSIILLFSWCALVVVSATIIWHYSAAYFTIALSVLIIAFGALESMQQTAQNVFSLVGKSILRIATVHMIFFICFDVNASAFSFITPMSGAAYILMLDIIFAFLIVTMPTHIMRLGEIRPGA